MALLKRDAFHWNKEIEKAFQRLKMAVKQPLVSALPDLNKIFIIECDAFGIDIRVVLLQERRPISYFSKGLKGRELILSTYEKELLDIVMAIQKWCPHLLDSPFRIRID